MSEEDDTVRTMSNFIQLHLNEIETAFVPGVKLTLIARFDNKPEADFLVTCDDLDEVAAVVERSKSREAEQCPSPKSASIC